MRKLLFIPLCVLGCTGKSLVNKTSRFLGDESTWGDARFIVQDVQGLWGGVEIYVAGTGKTVVRVVTPEEGGLKEKRYVSTLDTSVNQILIGAFIKNNFLTINDSERPGIPDEAHPSITLINAEGERHTVWRWDGDMNKRFSNIMSEFRKIWEKVEKTEPVFEGEFMWEFDWVSALSE